MLKFSLFCSASKNVLGIFGKDEDGGAVTVGFVLWLPVYFLILGVVIDACYIMNSQAKMYSAASDAARRYTARNYVGDDTTKHCNPGQMSSKEAATQSYAQSAASVSGHTPTVTVDECGGVISVAIAYDLAAIDITGVLGFVAGNSVQSTVVQPVAVQ